jgi:hypothetical protein
MRDPTEQGRRHIKRIRASLIVTTVIRKTVCIREIVAELLSGCDAAHAVAQVRRTWEIVWEMSGTRGTAQSHGLLQRQLSGTLHRPWTPQSGRSAGSTEVAVAAVDPPLPAISPSNLPFHSLALHRHHKI